MFDVVAIYYRPPSLGGAFNGQLFVNQLVAGGAENDINKSRKMRNREKERENKYFCGNGMHEFIYRAFIAILVFGVDYGIYF